MWVNTDLLTPKTLRGPVLLHSLLLHAQPPSLCSSIWCPYILLNPTQISFPDSSWLCFLYLIYYLLSGKKTHSAPSWSLSSFSKHRKIALSSISSLPMVPEALPAPWLSNDPWDNITQFWKHSLILLWRATHSLSPFQFLGFRCFSLCHPWMSYLSAFPLILTFSILRLQHY